MYESEEFMDLFGAAVGCQWESVAPEYPSNGFQNDWSLQEGFYHSSPVSQLPPPRTLHVPPPPPPAPLPQPPLQYSSQITHNSTSTSSGSSELQANGNSGKQKRVRTAFTSSQLLELEAVFRRTTYVTKTDRTELCTRLGLKDRAIKVWFQNRRMKHKKEGGKFSLDGGSSPQPEVCSSTTDFSAETTFLQQYHQQPSQTNYDSSFASLQAQEIFNRAVFEYNNSNKQPDNQFTNNLVENRCTFVERSQYDNISPVPQFSNHNYFTHSNEFSTPFVKLPDSTTPANDASNILNGIEMDLKNYRDDSGLVSMNSESLDKLGALVSQCITSDVVDTASDSFPYMHVSGPYFDCENTYKAPSDILVPEFSLVEPSEIYFNKSEATQEPLDAPIKTELNIDEEMEIGVGNSIDVTHVDGLEAKSVDIKFNVADIPLPGE